LPKGDLFFGCANNLLQRITQVLAMHTRSLSGQLSSSFSHILQHAPDVGSIFTRFAICQVPVELALEEQMPGSLCMPVVGLRRECFCPQQIEPSIMDVGTAPGTTGVRCNLSEPLAHR